MNPTVVVCVATVMTAMLISTSFALPPDFFRAGRGFPIPLHKKSSPSVAIDPLDIVCGYCGAYSPQLEMDCRRGVGETRKICTLTLLNQLQEFSSDKVLHPAVVDQE